MLGDGIVSFGVCSGVATLRRKANASPKIVSDNPIRPSTCADIAPAAKRSRACSSSGGRRRLPT